MLIGSGEHVGGKRSNQARDKPNPLFTYLPRPSSFAIILKFLGQHLLY